MRLRAKARPVRIRIVSGGMEHSSLQSLKEHFVLGEIIEPLNDGRLVTWLRQIGEVDFAQVIDTTKGKVSDIESRKKLCECFGVKFTMESNYDNFELMKEEFKKDTKKDYEVWNKVFTKCREHNVGVHDIAMFQARWLLDINKKDEAKAILASIKDVQLEAAELWDKYFAKEEEEIERDAEKFIAIRGTSVTIRMLLVRGGEFKTGNGIIKLNDYYISDTVVTRALWKAITGESIESRHPITYKSWIDCKLFIDELNRRTSQNFNFPSSIKWMFAASERGTLANNCYSGGTDLGEVGWYVHNSNNKLHEVGMKKPNRLGIFDMSGNVWEFSSNVNNGSIVCHGGSYNSSSRDCTVFSKLSIPQDVSSNNIGFRLCMEAE